MRKLIMTLLSLLLLPVTPVGAQQRPQLGFLIPPDALLFPQFVVGTSGGFSFDAELRIANTGSPFTGVLEVIDDRFIDPWTGPALPPEVLVNGEPYPFEEGGIAFQLGFGESMSLTFTPAPGEGTAGNPAGEEEACLHCFALLTCVEDCQVNESPAGITGDRIDDLVLSLFYNVRDGEGHLVDKVNVPPSRGGERLYFVMGRGQGFDTGVAIFAEPGPIGARVFLQEDGSSPEGTPNVINTTFELTSYRNAFFLSDVIPELPEEVPAALVQLFHLGGGGELWGVALGVQVENGTLQISGQTVKASDFPVVAGR